MIIIVRNVFVKTHHSIDMIEKYHDFLRRIYNIIIEKIFDIEFELILQMTFKTFNDSIKFNDFVFILLIFDVYFKMIEFDVPSFTITQKIMNQIKKDIAFRRIHDALNFRNDFSIDSMHALFLNSMILIFRKNNVIQSKT